MNTITDNSILLEEARTALREMRKYNYDCEESLETLESYVNRVRTVCISKLTDYVIENKLSPVHQQVIKDYWFNNIPPNETAKRLNLSLRGVYSSRTNAQNILKDYLEPLIMYFRNLPSADIMPAVIKESLSVLGTEKRKCSNTGRALESIRLASGAEISLAAKVLNIDEKELVKKEKQHKEPSVSELKKYSKAFGKKIILEIDNGNGEVKWINH